jgi:biotin transport system substrate-specific component
MQPAATPSHRTLLALDARGLGLAGQVGMILLGSLALALAAKVQVPFYPVPMTLQTLVVLLIGAFCGWRLGALTVLAYLGYGLAGLPVFAGPVSGPLYMMGPTGGFLVGFLASAIMAGLAVERFGARRLMPVLLAMLAGQAILFGLGWLWLANFAKLASGATGVGLERAFSLAVAPFIAGDVLKTVIAALVVRAAANR